MSNFRNFSACKTISMIGTVIGGRDSIKKMEGKQSFELVSLLTAGKNVPKMCRMCSLTLSCKFLFDATEAGWHCYTDDVLHRYDQ